MSEQLYLDHNASTPIAPEVREAMLPYLSEAFGNPSSSHWAGAPAAAAVERARAQVADFIGASPAEIVFTSGGSEANNTAIKGIWYQRGLRGQRLVTSAVEHPATAEPCRFLAQRGAQVGILPVDSTGRVNPEELEPYLDGDLVLLTVMHANNEVGTVQPVRALADLAHRVGALVHTDAAQSAGKIPVRVADLGVDLLSLAGHKLYAPKGVGALYVRQGVVLEPLIHGAGHEGGRRAGTESALLAVGLGAACALAQRELAKAEQISHLRDRLWDQLHQSLGAGVVLQGHPQARLPNTLNIAFVGQMGEVILNRCPGLAASTGAACHGGGAELSDTLRAMAVVPTTGAGTVRLSLGRHTTPEEIDRAAAALIAAATTSA
jgi:cysteine desulfurase